MKKRLLSLLLSVFMLIGITPTFASAEGDPVSVFDVVTYSYATTFSGTMITGSGIGGSSASHWVAFDNIDFGMLGIETFKAYIATSSPYHNQYVYFHIDSKDTAPFAQVKVTTGWGWNSYVWYTAELLDSNITGVHTVYVTYQGDGAGNLSAFQATPAVQVLSEEDVPETVSAENLSKEFMVLRKLGMIEFDEKFDATTLITANEFTKAVLMMIGEKEQYAIEDMLGLCQVDPTGTITAQKASEMIIYMLNRQMLMFDNQTYYDYADSIEINSKAGPDEELTWANAIRLLYDAIGVAPVVINSVTPGADEIVGGYITREKATLLTEYRNIYKSKGIVTMDYTTGLDSMSDIPEGTILIGEYIFDVGECNTAGLLGYEVEYYYQAGDHENTLVYIGKTANNQTLEFDAKDYDEYKDGYLYYNDGPKEKNVKVPQDVKVIYNGAALSRYSDSTFNIVNGSIELICNDRDGQYDVIKIWDTVDEIFGGIDQNIMYFKSNDALTISLDDPTVSVKCMLAGDIEVPFERLTEDAVCTIAETTTLDGRKLYNIWLSTKVVSGSVSSVNKTDRIAVVKDTEYGISGSFIERGAAGLVVGAQVKAYLNVYDEIANIASNVANNKIGHIAKVYKGEENEDDIYVKIFGIDGQWGTYKCYDNIRIDNVKATNPYEVLSNKLDLCVFSTNAMGELNSVKFAKDHEAEKAKAIPDDSNGLYLYERLTDSVYFGPNAALSSYYILAKDWKRFSIPVNRSDYDAYEIITSKFTHGEHVNVDVYNTELGQLDVNIGVTYNIGSSGSGNVVPVNTADLYYLVDIENEWNGEFAQYTLTYYNGEHQTLLTNTVGETLSSMPIMSQLKVGDGIKIRLNGDNIIGITRCFSVEDNIPIVTDEISWAPDSLIMHGNVAQKVSNVMTINYYDDETGTTKLYKFAYDLTKPAIYVYENGEVTIGNTGDIFSAEAIASGSEVYCFTADGAFRSMLVVKK